MTTEEWAKVKGALETFFSAVTLDADGYRVELRLVRIGTYKNAIGIYVNGVFKGKWLVEDCEERRRFLPCKEKFMLSPQKIKKLAKECRISEKVVKSKNKKYKEYSSHWTSFSSLKKHFLANNTEIKLVEIV